MSAAGVNQGAVPLRLTDREKEEGRPRLDEAYVDTRNGRVVYVGAVCDVCIVLKAGPLTRMPFPYIGRIQKPEDFHRHFRLHQEEKGAA